MALFLIAGAGYAYYQQQEARFHLDEGLTLEGESISSTELFVHEAEHTICHATISTVTLFEGKSADDVKGLFQKRVDMILEANPWLCGIVAQRRSDPRPRLFWGIDGNAPSSFQCYVVGQVPISSGTPYHLYEDLIRDYNLQIPNLPSLVGSSKYPLWKVSLIPDYDFPERRFAVFVSMAHVLGDAQTFYQLHNMLFSSLSLSTVQQPERSSCCYALDPVRKSAFLLEIEQRLGGPQEASYLMTTNPAIWEKSKLATNVRNHEILLFSISTQWLENEAQLLATREQKVSISAILFAHFLRACQPTVGMIAKGDWREVCESISDLDAGNYKTPIPLLPVDFETPELVQLALDTGKRQGMNSTSAMQKNSPSRNNDEGSRDGESSKDMMKSTQSELPLRILTAGPQTTFAVGVDWTQHFYDGGVNFLCEEGIKPTLHLPMAMDPTCLPPRLSGMILFSPKPDVIGALCIVSTRNGKEIGQRIIASGMIGDTLAVV
jgi:hypothetical protein